MIGFSFYFNRFLLFTTMVSSFFVQVLPLSAASFPLTKHLNELNHPASRLIENKLNKLNRLAKDIDNPKNFEKVAQVLVDLKFDLWNDYQMHVSVLDALDQLEERLKETGIKEAKKYLRPLTEKLKKLIRRRYKEEKEKHKTKAAIDAYALLNEIDRDFQEEEKDFYLETLHQAGEKYQKDPESKIYDNCLPSFSFWTTAALIGVFVSTLPIPGAFKVGYSLVLFAGSKCVESIINAVDEEHKRKEKEKEGSECSQCDDRHCPYHEERKKERQRAKENYRRRLL